MKDSSVKFANLHNNRSHVSDKTTDEIVRTRGFRLWFGIFEWNAHLRYINWNESLIYAIISNLFAHRLQWINQRKICSWDLYNSVKMFNFIVILSSISCLICYHSIHTLSLYIDGLPFILIVVDCKHPTKIAPPSLIHYCCLRMPVTVCMSLINNYTVCSSIIFMDFFFQIYNGHVRKF